MSSHREINPHFARPRRQQDDQSHQPTVPLIPPPQPQATHRETNPHFFRPRRQQDDQSHQPTVPLIPPPQPQAKRSKPSKGPQSSRPDKHVRPSTVPVGRKDQPQPRDDENIRPSIVPVEHKDRDSEPPRVPSVPLPQQHRDGRRPEPHGSPVPHPQREHPGARGSQAAVQPHHQGRTSRSHSLWLPSTQRTNFLTWFGAVFCAIFWIVIIIGGLVILIVYLVFRPRSPRFDVSTATLNAAYLDMGYLLNADLTVLANFTNPNRKMSVDFSYLTIELYYGKTLIAKQFLEPFSAAKAQTKFAYLHMITSQVRLPILEVRRLNRQMETNRVELEVKGYFRARSNFGSLLRYSYWLHGQCTIIVTRPPDGTLIASKCKTKH